MTLPTTGVFFNSTTPAAPPGDQNMVPQSDGGYPSQNVTFHAQKATTSLLGTVRPDGTTITVDVDGTIHAVGGGGGTGGATLHQEVPSGPIDGSNLSYALSAAPASGIVIYTRNGVQEDPSTYVITGTALTRTVPLQPGFGSPLRLAEKHLITYWA